MMATTAAGARAPLERAAPRPGAASWQHLPDASVRALLPAAGMAALAALLVALLAWRLAAWLRRGPSERASARPRRAESSRPTGAASTAPPSRVQVAESPRSDAAKAQPSHKTSPTGGQGKVSNGTCSGGGASQAPGAASKQRSRSGATHAAPRAAAGAPAPTPQQQRRQQQQQGRHGDAAADTALPPRTSRTLPPGADLAGYLAGDQEEGEEEDQPAGSLQPGTLRVSDNGAHPPCLTSPDAAATLSLPPELEAGQQPLEQPKPGNHVRSQPTTPSASSPANCGRRGAPGIDVGVGRDEGDMDPGTPPRHSHSGAMLLRPSTTTVSSLLCTSRALVDTSSPGAAAAGPGSRAVAGQPGWDGGATLAAMQASMAAPSLTAQSLQPWRGGADDYAVERDVLRAQLASASASSPGAALLREPHQAHPAVTGRAEDGKPAARKSVTLRKRASTSLAHLGSTLLASLREVGGGGGGGGSSYEQPRAPTAMFSDKSGDKRLLFKANKVLPTPTIYAMVHPKPPAPASSSGTAQAPSGARDASSKAPGLASGAQHHPQPVRALAPALATQPDREAGHAVRSTGMEPPPSTTSPAQAARNRSAAGQLSVGLPDPDARLGLVLALGKPPGASGPAAQAVREAAWWLAAPEVSAASGTSSYHTAASTTAPSATAARHQLQRPSVASAASVAAPWLPSAPAPPAAHPPAQLPHPRESKLSITSASLSHQARPAAPGPDPRHGGSAHSGSDLDLQLPPDLECLPGPDSCSELPALSRAPASEEDVRLRPLLAAQEAATAIAAAGAWADAGACSAQSLLQQQHSHQHLDFASPLGSPVVLGLAHSTAARSAAVHSPTAPNSDRQSASPAAAADASSISASKAERGLAGVWERGVVSLHKRLPSTILGSVAPSSALDTAVQQEPAPTAAPEASEQHDMAAPAAGHDLGFVQPWVAQPVLAATSAGLELWGQPAQAPLPPLAQQEQQLQLGQHPLLLMPMHPSAHAGVHAALDAMAYPHHVGAVLPPQGPLAIPGAPGVQGIVAGAAPAPALLSPRAHTTNSPGALRLPAAAAPGLLPTTTATSAQLVNINGQLYLLPPQPVQLVMLAPAGHPLTPTTPNAAVQHRQAVAQPAPARAPPKRSPYKTSLTTSVMSVKHAGAPGVSTAPPPFASSPPQ